MPFDTARSILGDSIISRLTLLLCTDRCVASFLVTYPRFHLAPVSVVYLPIAVDTLKQPIRMQLPRCTSKHVHRIQFNPEQKRTQ